MDVFQKNFISCFRPKRKDSREHECERFIKKLSLRCIDKKGDLWYKKDIPFFHLTEWKEEFGKEWMVWKTVNTIENF